MEAETIEKEEYRKMSGMQELQWSKGNDPVLTPPNFIETNLMTINGPTISRGNCTKIWRQSPRFISSLSRKRGTRWNNGKAIKSNAKTN